MNSTTNSLPTWRDKTCERCVFREGFHCRRFPPTIYHRGLEKYPQVATLTRFKAACAEYAESLERERIDHAPLVASSGICR